MIWRRLKKRKQQALPRVISAVSAKNRFEFLKARIVFRFLGFVAFVIVLCLFSIWARVQVVGLNYDINALKQQRESLLDDNKRFRIELSVLLSPARIEKVFAEGLSLALPDKSRVVEVKWTEQNKE
jgi:cell division protein FtsL